MNTATKIKEVRGFRGEAAVYRLDPPYRGEEYVVASSIYLPKSPWKEETVIFPSTEAGEVPAYSDLAMVKEYSHAAALASIGYEVKS